MKSSHHGVLAIPFLAGLWIAQPAAAQAPSPSEAQAIAKEATIYGYPMVENYKTMFG